MPNYDHLNALNLRLSHERTSLAQAESDSERELRGVWVKQIEKEVREERAFLGLPAEESMEDISADDLLAALLE